MNEFIQSVKVIFLSLMTLIIPNISVPEPEVFTGSGTMRQLNQFRSTTTPFSAITTSTSGKGLYMPFGSATTSSLAILGITSECLETDASGNVVGSGGSCAGAGLSASDYFASTSPQTMTRFVNQMSTSWLSGATVSTTSDTTKFSVSSGTGIVVDNHTDPLNPTVTDVSWSAFIDQTVTNIATQTATQLAVDVSGNLVQSVGEFFTQDRLRDLMTVGFLVHTDKTNVDTVTQEVDVIPINIALSLRDLTIVLGSQINLLGNVLSANGTNLQMDFSFGITYAATANKDVLKDPYFTTTSATTTITWKEVWRDGSGGFTFGAATTTFNPTIFDDGTGGASQANGVVKDTRYAVHRLFFLPLPAPAIAQSFFIVRGQDTYASFAEAILGIQSEEPTTTLSLEFIPPRAWVIVKGNATDLSNTTQARFFEADKFGEQALSGGIEVGTANVHNIANGIIITQPIATTTSDGSTVTFNLDNFDKSGDGLTVQFDSHNFFFDTATSTTLAAGSDTNPTTNYIFLTRDSNDVISMVTNTTGFPSTEHAPIAVVIVPSAVTVQAEKEYSFHLWDNNLGNGQGVIEKIAKWIRGNHATYLDGIAQTLTIDSVPNPDTVVFTSTSGNIRQFRDHSFPARDISSDFLYVVNDSSTAFATTTDINTMLTDSLGVSMSGNYFNIVIWGNNSEDEEDSKLFANLPSCSYNKEVDAVGDSLSCTNQTIPNDFRGTGFLISRLTLRHQAASSGTWTSIVETDLRGVEPSIIGGGGATGVITTFSDNTFEIFDETDSMKRFSFQASGITSGATRIYTVPDVDTNFWADDGSVPLTANWDVGAFQLTASNFIADDATATSTFAGGVGIGTSSPAFPLSIKADSSENAIAIQDNSGSNFWTIDTSISNLTFSRNGATRMEIDGGGFLRSTFFSNLDGTNFIDMTNSPDITIFTDSNKNQLEFGAIEAVFNEGSIDLDHRIESDNFTHAFFLEGSSGNISIGGTEATPLAAFEVSSLKNVLTNVANTTNYATVLKHNDAVTGNGVGLGFSVTNIDNNIGAAIIHKRTDGNSKGELQFYTKQTTVGGTAPTQVMVLTDAGLVGIGTTSPFAKLSVVGQIVAEFFTATSTTATSTFAGHVDISGQLKGLNLSGTQPAFWLGDDGFPSFYLGKTDIATTNGESFGILAADDGGGTDFRTFAQGDLIGVSQMIMFRGVGGATVFNDESADLDFVIESDDNANMFKVDAGNNTVSIASLTGFIKGAAGVLSAVATLLAGDYGAASIDGDDINSNIAGRSLTLTAGSPDTLDIDSEIFTYGIGVNLFATTTADGISTTTEDFIAVRVPIDSTITSFDCYAVDTGTSTIRATVSSDPLSAGTDILFSTGVECGNDVYTATSSFSTTAVSAGDIIRFYVSDAEPTGSRPRIVYPNFQLTKDD